MGSHNFHICSEQLITSDYTRWLSFPFIILYLFIISFFCTYFVLSFEFSFFRLYFVFSFVFSFFRRYFVFSFVFSFFRLYFVISLVLSLFCLYFVLSFIFSLFHLYLVHSFLLCFFVCWFFSRHKLFIGSIGSTKVVLMSSWLTWAFYGIFKFYFKDKVNVPPPPPPFSPNNWTPQEVSLTFVNGHGRSY
jgi:hypothetical protein